MTPVMPTKIVPLEKPIMWENLSGRSEPDAGQIVNDTMIQTLATPMAPAIKARKAAPLNHAETAPIRIIIT